MTWRGLAWMLTGAVVACGPSAGDHGGAGSGDATTVGDGDGDGSTDDGRDSASSDADADGTTSPADGSTGDPEPPWEWSPACIDGLDGPPVGATQAADILARLLHEADHHAEQVLEESATQDGSGPKPFDYEESNDSGSLSAQGTISIAAAAVSATHTVELVCFDGGHGSFGPVALDGRLDVSVDGTTDTPDDYVVTLSGEVRLGGGDAYVPTAPTDVGLELSVLGGQPTVTGTIGAHDAATL